MGVFDDNPFIQVKAAEPPAPSAPDPDEIARGGSWTLVRQDGQYRIDYLSGELMGRSRSLAISPQEAEDLKAGGQAAAEKIFARHGVG